LLAIAKALSKKRPKEKIESNRLAYLMDSPSGNIFNIFISDVIFFKSLSILLDTPGY